MPVTPRLQLHDQGDVRLVRFLDRRLFDDVVVREVGDQLLAAMPRGGSTAMVLDFSGVETISSSMLVKLLLLQRQMDAQRRQLRLCELSDTVRGVFRTTNLDRLFHIDRDLNEATEAVRGRPGR